MGDLKQSVHGADSLHPSTVCLQVSSAVSLANSLDPDKSQQNVSPDLDPNCLTPMIEFFQKVDFEVSPF